MLATKAIDVTATTNGAGEIVLNGEIPASWTDYTGANATISGASGMCATARRTGPNQITIRVFRQVNGIVELYANTQLSVFLSMFGTT